VRAGIEKCVIMIHHETTPMCCPNWCKISQKVLGDQHISLYDLVISSLSSNTLLHCFSQLDVYKWCVLQWYEHLSFEDAREPRLHVDRNHVSSLWMPPSIKGNVTTVVNTSSIDLLIESDAPSKYIPCCDK
jgi:hypothetical protein